jgi:threonine dehydratase
MPTANQLLADYVERIERARVYETAIETPLDFAPRLSARLGNEIFLKREDLQPIFSFKCRGAQNRLAQAPPARLRHGVVCSSAGNHAQGVALAAGRLGIRALIVMPEGTPSIKIDAVSALGGEIVLHGQAYDDAYAHAVALADARGLEFVHPFADPDVIAGQGTIGREIEAQSDRRPAAVFIPIGGGGLASGIGAWLRSRWPEVRLIGVEPVDAASMHAALAAGGPVDLGRVGIFADGVAVRRVAEETFRICREVIDMMIQVDTDEICAAIKDIYEDTRVVDEPAGALAVAGMKRWIEQTDATGERLIAINSGANLNFDRLRHISERADIGEHLEALFAVEIPERKGAFLEFCTALGKRNVTEFNYRYTPGALARIFVGVGLTGSRTDAREIVGALAAGGYRVLDLGDNELARLHVRHMVGGPVPDLEHEVIYRFEFPERPGALLAFLRAVGVRWNISLFHYRNHGSDYGRVLAGVQVPPAERDEFLGHLDRLGYSYWPESDNPAYRLFLSAGGNPD